MERTGTVNELEALICEVETEACKDIDKSKWEKTRFYLDGVEQTDTKITYGY